MQISAKQLRQLLMKLEAADPCSIHGREFLEVCAHCDSVRCMKCRTLPCQCENDE